MKDKKTGVGDQGPAASSTNEHSNPGTRPQVPGSCSHCDEYLLGWRRALADYDNLKKDLATERTRMRDFTSVDAIQRILPVLDNFDAALAFKPETTDHKIENWLQGLLYVRTQLETVVSEFGATAFGEVGDAFDPLRYDAAGEKEVEGKDSGIVIEIVRRGWKRSDHVIRPAKVIISK